MVQGERHGLRECTSLKHLERKTSPMGTVLSTESRRLACGAFGVVQSLLSLNRGRSEAVGKSLKSPLPRNLNLSQIEGCERNPRVWLPLRSRGQKMGSQRKTIGTVFQFLKKK